MFFAFPFVFILKPFAGDIDLYNLYFLYTYTFFMLNAVLQGLFLNNINIDRNQLFKYYLAVFFLILINFNFQEFSFSIYLVFIFFLIVLISAIQPEIEIRKFHIYIRAIIIIYFLTSSILIFIPQYSMLFENETRYAGLWLSPTVCGILSLIYYITFLNFSSKKDIIMRVLLYFVLMMLLVIAKSRINLFLGILIPGYFYFVSAKRLLLHKRKMFVLLIFTGIFFYPIYEFTKINNFEARQNADDSDRTRLAYSALLLKEFQSSTITCKIFGNKANSSLSLIGDDSIKPHNDFLRVVYDYGVLFLLLYIFILYYYYQSSTYMSFIIVIYIFSFYHNMIFDFFLLVYLIFMRFMLKSNYQKTLKHDLFYKK